MNKTYIEIRNRDTDEIEERIDVTDRSEQMTYRILAGLGVVLDAEKYYMILKKED